MNADQYSGFLLRVILSEADNSKDFMTGISNELTKIFPAGSFCFIQYNQDERTISGLNEPGDEDDKIIRENIINYLKNDNTVVDRLMRNENCVLTGSFYLPLSLENDPKIFLGISGIQDNEKLKGIINLQTVLSSLWLFYEKFKEVENLRDQVQRSSINEAYSRNMIQKMKAPLNAISGFSGLLLENGNDCEKTASFLKIIGSSSDELIELTGMLEKQLDKQNEHSVIKIQKEHVPDYPQTTDRKEKTILVAEDDDVNYFLICQYLKDAGYQILRAANGLEAIEVCKTRDVDMILMDIAMPEMDGIEASIRIKAIKPGIKIIIQTAHLNEREKIMSSGCLEILAKPFRRQQLISLIESYI